MFKKKTYLFILLIFFCFSFASAEIVYKQKEVNNSTLFWGYLNEANNYETSFFLYDINSPINSFLVNNQIIKNNKFSFYVPFLNINDKYKLKGLANFTKLETRSDIPIVITESAKVENNQAKMYASFWVGDGPYDVEYWFKSYKKDSNGNITDTQTTSKKITTISKTSSHVREGIRNNVNNGIYCFIPYAKIVNTSEIKQGEELCFPDIPWVITLMPGPGTGDNSFTFNGKITNYFNNNEVSTWFKYYKLGDEDNFDTTPKREIQKPQQNFSERVSLLTDKEVETWCYRACAAGSNDYTNCGEEWCVLVFGEEDSDGEIETDKKAESLSGEECEQVEITLYTKCKTSTCKDVKVIDTLRSLFEYIPGSSIYINESGNETKKEPKESGNKLEWDLGDIKKGTHIIKFKAKFLDNFFPDQITNVFPDSKVVYEDGSVIFPEPNLVDPIACQGEDDDTEAEWTFFVYLAADNNLNNAGIEDIEEMAQIGSTDKVNIVVLYDGVEQNDSKYLYIKKGNVEEIKSVGEVNTGDPQVLIDAGKYLYDKFPAKKYALVLWNHGSGIKSYSKQETVLQSLDIGFDDGSGNDALDNKELDYALKEIGKDIELIAYDACLMHMVEIAYYTKDDAKYSEGSQEVEPGDGFEYNIILDALVKKPSMDGDELSVIISKSNINDGYHATASAVDLSKIEKLGEAVHEFSKELIDNGGINNISIQKAREDTANYYTEEYIDLEHFARNIIKQNISSDLNSKAKEVADTLEDAVLWNYGGHGLSIYYSKDVNNKYLDLSWSKDTCWDEFLLDKECDGTDDDGEKKDITFLIYMVADNNLQQWGEVDVKELAKVGSDNNVNFLVIWDGMVNNDSKLLYIEKNNIKVVESLGELNMGDPKVFEGNVIKAFNRFPAEKNVLVLWNHGGGVPARSRYRSLSRMIGWDDSQNDVLTDLEMNDSLKIIREETNIKEFDVIFEFACLMQMVEAIDYLQDDAKYIVASEEIGYANMTDYDKIADEYVRNPKMDSKQLTDVIFKNTNHTPTISIADTDKAMEFRKSLHEFSKALIDNGGQSNSKILSIFANEKSMYGGSYPYYDLKNILDAFVVNFSGNEIEQRAKDTIEKLDNLIVDYKIDPDYNGASILFERNSNLGDNYKELPFAKNTCWDEFLSNQQCNN